MKRLSNFPVNRSHPLNRGIKLWWLNLPNASGGIDTWKNIAGNPDATLSGFTSPYRVNSNERKGGFGHLEFGTGRVAEAPHILATDITGTQLTVSAWIKEPAPDAFDAIVWKGPNSVAQGYLLYYNGSKELSFGIGNGSLTIVSSTSFTPDADWHHFVGTYDGANLSLYVDGESAATPVAKTGNITTTAEILGIGKASSGGVNFDGSMDDVRIQETVWSAQQVKAYYQESKAGYPNTLNWQRGYAGLTVVSGTPTAVLTGTMLAGGIDEADITTGGKTIIITLTGDTFKTANGGPIGTAADTLALFAGFSAPTSPAGGWNIEVRDKAVVGDLTRDSPTQATWIVGAAAAFDIAAQIEITGTIPNDVLVTGV